MRPETDEETAVITLLDARGTLLELQVGNILGSRLRILLGQQSPAECRQQTLPCDALPSRREMAQAWLGVALSCMYGAARPVFVGAADRPCWRRREGLPSCASCRSWRRHRRTARSASAHAGCCRAWPSASERCACCHSRWRDTTEPRCTPAPAAAYIMTDEHWNDHDVLSISPLLCWGCRFALGLAALMAIGAGRRRLSLVHI